MSTISADNGGSRKPADLGTVASDAKAAAKSAASAATDAARSAVDDVKHEAGRIAGDATETAKSFATENKGRLADQIDAFVAAIDKAADELDGNDQGAVAGYVRQVSGGAHQLSSSLREKGVDELMGSVTDFARRQPALLIGGAALLGFVASRFAVAGASSRSSHPHSPNVGSGGTAPSDDASGSTVGGFGDEDRGAEDDWSTPRSTGAYGSTFGTDRGGV